MRKIALACACLLMSSCASSLGIGSDKFGCSGIPGKKVCSSAEDNYRKSDGELADSPWDSGKKGKRANLKNRKESQVIVRIKQRLVLPTQNNPIPVRTPAKVIRIWVAPWEDKAGDLHMASLVYSEVEKRRWVVGEPVGDAGLGVSWPPTASPSMPMGK